MNNFFSTTEEMWHKKDKSPEIGKWILVEIDMQYSQKYKVFKYVKPNCLVTGNYPNPSYTLQNWDETPIVRWIYLDTIIDEHTIDANKMMGLDEAAEEYGRSTFITECMEDGVCDEHNLSDAFKAGAKWCDAQIHKLSDSLDEAADAELDKHDVADLFCGSYEGWQMIEMFKAGAKWQSDQGTKVK